MKWEVDTANGQNGYFHGLDYMSHCNTLKLSFTPTKPRGSQRFYGHYYCYYKHTSSLYKTI